MTSQKETLKEERQIAKKIAKDFSSKYLAPDKNEITTITLHSRLIQATGGLDGIRDAGLLIYSFLLKSSHIEFGISLKYSLAYA